MTFGAPASSDRKPWLAPGLVVFGTVEDITAQTKYKSFGPADDVFVNNEQALHNVS